MRFLIRILVTSLTVFLLAAVLPGVEVENVNWAVLVSFVLILLNAYVKPVLVFLTLPVTILTLGLFLLVVNASIILLTAYLLSEGFRVDGFWIAMLFSLLLSVVTSLTERLMEQDNEESN
ncbi:MAG: phage holin family protein [Sphingobacteriales bacterium]|jgi:putative membrane protein|nr:phage holin family protein [Sphingobacteriales bacterium]